MQEQQQTILQHSALFSRDSEGRAMERKGCIYSKIRTWHPQHALHALDSHDVSRDQDKH